MVVVRGCARSASAGQRGIVCYPRPGVAARRGRDVASRSLLKSSPQVQSRELSLRISAPAFARTLSAVATCIKRYWQLRAPWHAPFPRSAARTYVCIYVKRKETVTVMTKL